MSKKICIVFTAIVLVSLSLIYFITYNAYSKNIKENAVALMNQAALSSSTVLENTIGTAKSITLAPSFSNGVEQSFKGRYEFNGIAGSETKFLYFFLSSLPNTSGSLVFFSTDGTILYSKAPVDIHEFLVSQYGEWNDMCSQNPGKCVLTAVDAQSGVSAAVLRSVVKIEDLGILGMGAVLLSPSDFEKSFSQISTVPGIREIILDSDGCVIFDSLTGRQNYSIAEDEVLYSLSSQAGAYECRIAGNNYIGNNYSPSGQQYRIMFFSEEKELLQSMRSTQLMLLIIALGILLISVLMILFMSNNLTHPLRKITSMIHRVQEGDFSVRFNNQTHDEIGMLGESFNNLLDKLNQQMDDIIAINSRKNAIEVDALRSQINPHFIYNTLETIHMMAIENDQPEIEKIALIFGRLIRYNISKLNEVTTLGRELEYLKDYVYIQNVRFEDEFNLVINVEDKARSCEMIKLLLQPLIENSISHGYAHGKGSGAIILTAQTAGDRLHISVEDEGEGIPTELLDQLKSDLENSDAIASNRNIGLRNVNSRIKLFYGSEYGLTIDNRPDKGIIAEITLPILKGGKASE